MTADEQNVTKMTDSEVCNILAGGKYIYYFQKASHDDSMGNYFILSCNARPDTEGQELEADIQWTMKTSIKRFEGVEFEVKKTSADGCVWLWNKTQGIGVVVRKL